MRPTTNPKPRHGANLCLRCWRYINGKCQWQPGDYCLITKSK